MDALAPVNLQTAIVDSDTDGRVTGLISRYFQQWLRAVLDRLQAAPFAVKTLTLINQGAAIPTTAILTLTRAGLYRVNFVARVTQAASVSSSFTVTLGWDRAGLSLTQTGAADTGNTTNTQQNGSVFVRAEAATDLTLAVAYASVGGTPMQFEIDIVAELVAS